MFNKIFITTFITLFLFSNSEAFASAKISFGGKNSYAICKFINEYIQPCEVIEKFNDDISALDAIRNGQLDMAITSYSYIKEDDQAKVIMLTSKDQKRVLVAESNLSKEIVSNILSTYNITFNSFAKNNLHLKKTRIFQPRNFRDFFFFGRKIPLHPAVIDFFLKGIRDPLSIGENLYHCDRETRSCVPPPTHTKSVNLGVGENLADIGLPVIEHLIPMLEDKNKYARIRASYALGAMWPQDIKRTTPALINLLNKEQDDDVRQYALQALGRMKKISPEIIQIFRNIASEEPKERKAFSDGMHDGFFKNLVRIGRLPISTQASTTLASIDPDVLDFYKNLIKSKSQGKRINALKGIFYLVRNNLFSLRKEGNKEPTLTDLTSESQEAIRLLQTSIQNNKYENYNEILYMISQLGSVAGNSYIALETSKYLYSSEEKCEAHFIGNEICSFPIQSKAIYTIMGIPKTSGIQEVFEGLLYVIESSYKIEREAALRALLKISKYNKIPSYVIKRLHEYEQKYNGSKELLISNITDLTIASDDKELITKLVEKLKKQLFIITARKDRRFDRSSIFKSLVKITKLHPQYKDEIMALLLKSLEEEKDQNILSYKIEHLRKLGKAGEIFIPYLVNTLSDSNSLVIILKANSNLPTPPPPPPGYGLTIKDNSHQIIYGAVRALGEIGIANNIIISQLRKHGQWAIYSTRYKGLFNYTSSALLELLDDKEKVKFAIDLLDDDPSIYYTKLAALEALRKLGPKAKDAIDAIKPLAKHKDSLLRELAMTTLKAIGTKEALAIKEVTPPPTKPLFGSDWEEYLTLWYKEKYMENEQ